MSFNDFKTKSLGIIRKAGKKTVIATMAVIVIGVAVMLNFIIGSNTSEPVSLEEELKPVSAMLDGAEPVLDDDEFFASVTFNRRTARDEAMAVLKTVMESNTAVDEVKNSAYGDIQQIAGDIEREANIESLIEAKGFAQCVAVVNGNSASVIVKTPGLTPGEVAQISEIVYNETGIDPDDLKIIERK